jgi:hypothetical protein
VRTGGARPAAHLWQVSNGGHALKKGWGTTEEPVVGCFQASALFVVKVVLTGRDAAADVEHLQNFKPAHVRELNVNLVACE